jgi:hypothetical protein
VAEERKWLAEINRLMDRMRATEGALMKARGQVKPSCNEYDLFLTSYDGAAIPAPSIDGTPGGFPCA